MHPIKVLALDSGCTVLDRHGGVVAALRTCGGQPERDKQGLANAHRDRSLKRLPTGHARWRKPAKGQIIVTRPFRAALAKRRNLGFA